MEHRTNEELHAGLDAVRESPSERGTLELIARRPAVDEREVLEEGQLTTEDGLAGDDWGPRGSRHTPDGSAEPDRQLTIMNARAIALLAGDRSRWPLAGDQLYVDFDLSADNLPPGSRLRLGEAVVEVSEAPHNGCAKFAERYGRDAVRFVNSPEGKELRLRGINATVVLPGTIRAGDAVERISAPGS